MFAFTNLNQPELRQNPTAETVESTARYDELMLLINRWYTVVEWNIYCAERSWRREDTRAYRCLL